MSDGEIRSLLRIVVLDSVKRLIFSIRARFLSAQKSSFVSWLTAKPLGYSILSVINACSSGKIK